MKRFISTKVIELGSCAFRQWRATHSHCSKIHGYQLLAKFWFGCSALDDKNWCVDFGALKELKSKLQDQFDHTYCVAADDPLINEFKALDAKGALDLRVMPDGVGIERAAEFCFNLAQTMIKEKYGERCWVEKVEVFEHKDNSALFSFVPSEDVKEKPAPVTLLLETEPKQAVDTPDQQPNKRGAIVGGNVSTGLSNLFGGTSWG